MKNPLHYQISEYDCGPTSMLNAVSFLFEREDILPEVIRNIMLYSLDCYGTEGVPGKSGTSRPGWRSCPPTWEKQWWGSTRMRSRF